MIKKKSGHIIEMGSVASQYALGLPVYSATKGAIHSLSRALRIELNGTKIRHTEICPGRTSTSFFKSAFPNEKARSAFVDQIKNLDPEDIAAAMEYALNAPLHVNVSMIELTPVDQAPGARAPTEESSGPTAAPRTPGTPGNLEAPKYPERPSLRSTS